MHAPTNPILRPSRIAALTFIALLVIGLGYLRFASGSDPLAVPAGAHAGQLTLEPCHYGTEHGSAAADCGTLVVPENRADPHSRLIALPVIRIRARSRPARDPIFRLEGGPGLSNMHFADASRFTADRDVVLVGYRGADGSSVLRCPQVVSAIKHSGDLLSEQSLIAKQRAFRACAADLHAQGVDLDGYTLPERVDDLEAARHALGYHRIDLLSESAGTRTAMIYSWRYPKSIHRSVMIGVNPPGHFLWNGATIDGQIRQYSALCAADPSCRARTGNLAGEVRATEADMPDHWLFLPIKRGNVRVASFFGLMEARSDAAPVSAPMTLDAWLSAADGDASGFWFQSLMASLAFPEAEIWGEAASIARVDFAAAAESYASTRTRGSIIGNPGTDFLWSGGRLRTAWPASPDDRKYNRVQTSRTETLLIDGTLDFATPPRNATDELLPHLPNGHQALLPGLGHTTDFWSYEPNASSRLVNAFLDSGKVDTSLYTHSRVDFTPGTTQTLVAKIILGTMAGFIALGVLVLLWMPRRVHRRGTVGRVTSVLLRTMLPLVLGLGGWFLGALIVLTTMPRVPLDDELLAGLSIGLPVGLGMYWAWVHRDWQASAKAVGLLAALGGGLVGAWLGFNASSGALALLTTIVGAGVGSNVALIFLDVARERAVRDPLAESSRAPAFAGAQPEPEL